MDSIFADTTLVTSLQKGDKKAFEAIYKLMVRPLLSYVNSRINDKAVSEELVQEVFLSLWSRRKELIIESSLQSYLYGAAKFQILSYIRSEKVRQKYADHLSLYAAQTHDSTEELMNVLDLKAAIDEHIHQLPPKCQFAFRLSRFEHKSIAEIAEEMNISPRTVENYITQALKHLRLKLVQYPWVLILAILYN